MSREEQEYFRHIVQEEIQRRAEAAYGIESEQRIREPIRCKLKIGIEEDPQQRQQQYEPDIAPRRWLPPGKMKMGQHDQILSVCRAHVTI